jgi:hypothetical protein
MKLETAIKQAKKKLIKKAKVQGLYENFGQKEVRELEEDYLSLGYHPEEINAYNLILNFEKWCMDYSLDEECKK